jgi:hypothetical protein
LLEQTTPAPAPETGRGPSAAADVAAAFANRDSAKRKLITRAAGVDPAVAAELGY